MNEIRLAWNVVGREDLTGREIQAGLWFPDTPVNRTTLEAMVEAGNFAYGEGSHWIEEREA